MDVTDDGQVTSTRHGGDPACPRYLDTYTDNLSLTFLDCGWGLNFVCVGVAPVGDPPTEYGGVLQM